MNVRTRSNKSRFENSMSYKLSMLHQIRVPDQNAVLFALDNVTTSIPFEPCMTSVNVTVTSGQENFTAIDVMRKTVCNSTLKNPPCSDVTGHPYNNVSYPAPPPSSSYGVKTCDQVLFIDAKTMIDYDDCTSRKDAFFTMSMFMVNYFETKNSSALLTSILIEDMDELPIFVPGTKKQCLNFIDSKHAKRFAMCFPGSSIADRVYSSFMNFMKCRMGDNLRPLTLPQLRKVYQMTCAGNPIDPRMIFSMNPNDLKDNITQNILARGLNPYFGDKVPGS